MGYSMTAMPKAELRKRHTNVPVVWSVVPPIVSTLCCVAAVGRGCDFTGRKNVVKSQYLVRK